MDESYGNGEGRLHNFGDDDDNNFGDVEYINFLSAGSVAGTFTWNDERTLSQIEQMTGYSVKPLGVKSQFKHGGYVVQESNGHGLVAAVCDIGQMNWNDAITACQELVMNGYSDWVLPNKDQLELIFKNLHQKGIGGFSSEDYWSSSEDYAVFAWCFNFYGGQANDYNNAKHYTKQVRAVRAF
jgi:hypothetical protein